MVSSCVARNFLGREHGVNAMEEGLGCVLEGFGVRGVDNTDVVVHVHLCEGEDVGVV